MVCSVAGGRCDDKKDNEVRATSGKGCSFPHIFKPITTASRRVPMKGIACSTERVERRVSINIVDMANVRLIKTKETWKKGEGKVGI